MATCGPGGGGVAGGTGRREGPGRGAEAGEGRKAAADHDDEVAAPEDISLPTASGVELAATYYAGAKGKESVPVVLLHGFKGSRKDYAELAPYLREKLGCAVLVPDLRGHGESTKSKNGGTLTADKMRPLQFQAMVAEDMVAILDFLRQENNGLGKKPRLNLNKLCLVGADMGADVALEFARLDWSQPSVGQWQMGGFTKALVLLSPEWSSHGLKLGAALANPDVRSRISVLLVVGKNSAKFMSDAKTRQQDAGTVSSGAPAGQEKNSGHCSSCPWTPTFRGRKSWRKSRSAFPT